MLNNSVHAGTKVSAFRCLFGYEVSCPLDLALSQLQDNKVQAVDDLVRAKHEVHAQVRAQLQKYTAQMTKSANKHRRDVQFSVGDLVHVSTAHLKLPAGLTRKLTPLFVGPFVVTERIGAVSYRVALLANFGGVHNVFHVSLLKLHSGAAPYQRAAVFVPET